MPRTLILDPSIRLATKSTLTESGCLEWTGVRSRDGYGMTSYLSRSMRAHRLAWILAHGPIPEGAHVLHACDNPPCILVDHLFLGTPADNARDRASKGRGAHPMAVLTEADVRAIRVDPRRHSTIAEDYGVARCTIRSVKYRQTWKWLDDE